jgi:hypothetical protein
LRLHIFAKVQCDQTDADLAKGFFGMRMSAIRDLRWIIVAFVCALPAATAVALDLGTAAGPPTPSLSPEQSTALGDALIIDSATLNAAAPAKPLRLPSLSEAKGLDVSHSAKPDGSRTLAVKQPLATEWDAKVGADLGLGPTPADGYRPSRLVPDDGRGSGAAWASVGVPNFASIDARVDPTHDQGKLGTTFKHAMPIGNNFSMTLQNSYSVTGTYGTPQAGPSDVPLMSIATAPAGQPTPQVWGNEKLAKFDVLPTGTTLAAGLTSTSIDPVTHNKLSAEQKLYGPLHVTTAVTDVGQPVSNKSITAGFKLNW